ncbi:hypothetical protein RB653_006383 [Dictyostelium firmibasis]|uniref:Pre-mRNA-splicing factor spf27 n=1 Tax=Dictyostelium firmibasis TaxID=79012 RepID=A0AAN7Z045_9MYCE
MNIIIEGAENIDSLPYVDDSVNENEQELINKLISDEMSTFTPPDYLAQLPSFIDIDYNNFQFLENDFKRMEKGENMKEFDIGRYKVEPTTTITKQQVNEKQWNDNLNNARSQLEHQDIRKINLELLQRYGGNSWKLYLSDLEILQKTLKKQLDQKKQQIEEINIQRKLSQEQTYEKIQQHDKKFLELVYKNTEIESACKSIELEIEQLKLKQELQHQQQENGDLNNK